VILALYHIVPGWSLLLLPVWIVMLLLSATGIGLVVTSLMVSYRDVQYVMTLALQILMYATPIVYPASRIPAHIRFWFQLNPLYSLFEAIRWSLIGDGTLDLPRLAYSAAASVVILLIGVLSFKKMEQKFADVI
jgi:lipopolysaccharide transport system permease protein